MSKERTESFTCPVCGHQGEFTLWESVNVDLDESLREKVLTGELFDWICPSCGQRIHIKYGTLYHDMKHQFMIFYDPSDDATEIKKIEIPEMFTNLGDYKYRQVLTENDLREKIMILETGLSDVAIEYAKYTLRHFRYKEEIQDTDEIRFAGFDQHEDKPEPVIVFVILDEECERRASCYITLDEYDGFRIKELTDYRLHVGQCEIVNQDWIESKLRTL